MALADVSKAKAFLVFLALVIFAMSASILGLSAHGIAYYFSALDDDNFKDVQIQAFVYNSSTQESTRYLTNLAYTPKPDLDMGDMYALLMTGILGSCLSFLILLGAMRKEGRSVNLSLTGRTVRPVRILGETVTLVFDILLLIVFLTTAGYTWAAVSASPLYLDSSHMGDLTQPYTWYSNQNGFTFETWNCALGLFTTLDATNPSRTELYGLCKEARAARIMAMVLFAITFIRMAVHFWAWRRHNVAVRLGKAQGHRSGDIRLKETSRQSSSEQQTRRSSSERRTPRGGSDEGRTARNVIEGPTRQSSSFDAVAELPAYRLSRVEAPEEGLGEMPGENGSKELPAETVAIEMDASRGAEKT